MAPWTLISRTRQCTDYTTARAVQAETSWVRVPRLVVESLRAQSNATSSPLVCPLSGSSPRQDANSQHHAMRPHLIRVRVQIHRRMCGTLCHPPHQQHHRHTLGSWNVTRNMRTQPVSTATSLGPQLSHRGLVAPLRVLQDVTRAFRAFHLNGKSVLTHAIVPRPVLLHISLLLEAA